MKSGRALKRYGGEVGSSGLITQEPLPDYFKVISSKLFDDGLFKCENHPNHVLLNKYRPGDGIMAHKDGPAYFPYVCILSLHQGLILNIYSSLDDVASKTYLARFYLEPRSLFIFTDEHYKEHFHGIEETIEDSFAVEDINNIKLTDLDYKLESKDSIIKIPREEYRLSLTIRYVPLE
jgi:alkylated DNA repair protein alkB homolog 6